MGQEQHIFGRLASGEVVERITISGGGLTAHVLTWGAVIQDLRLDGHDAPLVLGFKDFSAYLDHSPYFGATPGRCANRIGGGRFAIDGTGYQLECNERGIGHLHGGSDGTGRQNWRIAEKGSDFVTLVVSDPNGRAGYPGNCAITCTYRLPGDGVLSVVYEAVTDAPTPVNLCQHSYFILDDGADALGHEIRLAAEHYLPVDENLIPTGEIRSVAGTPFDLREWTPLARQTEEGGVAFDHNFCLSSERVTKRRVAEVRSPLSGVSLTVLTTEPGVQLYTGSKVDTSVPGLEDRHYGAFAGFCLETQIWPDAVNHADFPNAILRPGETLRQETDYVFQKD
ncbi:galactose mutarotase [Shinella curvata]|uniref:Aldose 1-epimerase n=1 Tax=Shinella curvata TaxID=1817964 RepID=A0ABT8XK57_9HYPH|nr:aldose epimerase family protein [Shinella curvata]MCJ8056410.1 galactose mutarotase [Shinella curvata]MDO6124121.1 galactose mutarotase [Shinella curvata]